MKTISWEEQKWKDKKTWQGFIDGSLCPMCENNIYDEENEESFLVKELKRSVARLPKNQNSYGWVVMILKRHAIELDELKPAELLEFWQEVATVATALKKVHSAVKINYAIFGNHVPHVHCHLLVRTKDQDPSEPIKMDSAERYLQETEYFKMISELRKAMNT